MFVIYQDTDYLLIKLTEIKENRNQKLQIHSISPFTIKDASLLLTGSLEKSSNLNNVSWFKNGWQSWSPCKLLFGDQKDRKGPPLNVYKRTLDNQDYGIEGRFYSEYCTAITELSSKSTFILGFTTLPEQFSRIVLDHNDSEKMKKLTAFGCMDGLLLSESSIDYSEEIFVGFKSNSTGYYGLIDYASIVEEYLKEERISEIPIGWCSWYYYFTEISMEDMLKNIEFFKDKEEEIPIDFIQLDDGYFKQIGDYQDLNEKFSESLSFLFKKIENSGFK
ncbi:MAG: hypothetical protein EU550_02485, partial [Promethearchaeota archaeon]